MVKEELIKFIDFSKLKRNYIENPVKNYKDFPDKDDIIYLYLELNLSLDEIGDFISYKNTGSFIHYYNLEKSKELKIECRARRNIEKYGVRNPSQLKEIKEKIKKNNLKKYGVESTNKLPEKIQARLNTCLEKYGRKANSSFGRRWKLPPKEEVYDLFINQKFTKRELAEFYNITEFKAQDIVNTYGLREERKRIKKEQEKQLIRKYNFDKNKALHFVKKYQINLDKLKRNYIENPLKTSRSNRYHLELPEKEDLEYLYCEKGFSQTELSQFFGFKMVGNWLHKFKIKQNKEQISNSKKGVILRKYGSIENFKKLEYQTKKQNNSFNRSNPEKRILQLLLEKFPDTISQYRSDVYPFNCDFYIPSKDLYIEYQGSWTHGGKPFDKNNPEDLKKLESWKEKSKEINFKGKPKHFYLVTIDVWTIKDPQKRKIAKENNLNYLEFFTEKEFLNWFNQQESK